MALVSSVYDLAIWILHYVPIKATNASVILIPLSIPNSAMVTSLCLPSETGLYKAVLASEEKS